MKRKILFVDSSLQLSGDLGGAEECLRILMRDMSRRGYKVFLCAVASTQRLDFLEIDSKDVFVRFNSRVPLSYFRKIMRFKGGGMMTKYLLSRKLMDILETTRPDYVHINMVRKWDAFDVNVAKKSGVKVIGHLRSLGHQVRLRSQDLRRCDAIITVSEAVKNSVDDLRLGARAHVVYDPVDGAKYKSQECKREARSALGFEALYAEEVLLTSVAALERRKGHDTAIEALALLRSSGVNGHLLVAGGSYEGTDCAEIEYLARLGEQQGVRDHVSFLGRREDMHRVYAAADIVLALSKDGEAFGRVPIEAAFAERPVIATRAGATPEVVLNEVTGLTVEPGDARAVANAAKRLLDRPLFRCRMTEAARARAEKLFCVQRHVDQIEAVYRSLY